MREFTIRSGKFEGIHTIYDSVKEFNEHFPNTPFKEWGDLSINTNDWVRADDGYIVKCLHSRAWRNKSHRSGQITLLCRFPQGLFDIYLNSKGEKRVRHFYAQFAKSQKNTLSQGKTKSIKKREFLLRVKAGNDIYKAYMAVFKPRKRSKSELLYAINELMIELKEELMDIYSYLSSINQKIIEETGGDLKSLLAEKTANLLLLKNKATKDELAILKWAYEFFGKPLGIVEDPKRISENAQYSIEAPLTSIDFSLLSEGNHNDNKRIHLRRPNFSITINNSDAELLGLYKAQRENTLIYSR